MLSEVGSKDLATVIAPYRWVEMIEAELRAGAWKVITEARETGTAGIFRGDGEVRMGLIDEIVHAIDPNRLLFEAPQKAQQTWFIRKFGPNVNLGNIPPDEVIPLETLRLGLRADTLIDATTTRQRGRGGDLSPAGVTPGPIAPHGGALVERFDDSLDEGGGRPRVTLTARQQADLDLIAVGALSPLDGFMGREAYEAVVEDMRLPSGLAWSVPVTLGVTPGELEHVGSSDEVELVDEGGRFLGILDVTDRYETDPVSEARLVYGTEEDAHPGVASLYAHGTTALAGPVRVASRMPIDPAAAPLPARPAPPRAPSSTPAAGTAWSGSRPATRSTGRTSTSPRWRWRRLTASSSTPWSGRPRATTSPPTCGCAATRC